jgi:hypothetical protein
MIDIILPCNIIIAGSTMSGKSYFIINNLLPKILPQIDRLIICSSTLSINNDYKQKYAENGKTIFHIEKNIQESVKEIFQTQKDFYKLRNEGVLKNDQIPSIAIICDDLCNNPLFYPNGYLSKESIRSRHYKISIIITTQRICAIGRVLRLNSAYFICFSTMNYTELERVMLEFCPKKYHKQMQDKLMEIYSIKYNYLLTDNRQQDIGKRIYKNGNELIEFN